MRVARTRSPLKRNNTSHVRKLKDWALGQHAEIRAGDVVVTGAAN
jgi:hypothetical protein